jgi:hypothetical protein
MAFNEILEIQPAIIATSRKIYRVVINLDMQSIEIDWKWLGADGEYLNKTKENIMTGDSFLKLAGEKALPNETLYDFIKRVLYSTEGEL